LHSLVDGVAPQQCVQPAAVHSASWRHGAKHLASAAVLWHVLCPCVPARQWWQPTAFLAQSACEEHGAWHDCDGAGAALVWLPWWWCAGAVVGDDGGGVWFGAPLWHVLWPSVPTRHWWQPALLLAQSACVEQGEWHLWPAGAAVGFGGDGGATGAGVAGDGGPGGDGGGGCGALVTFGCAWHVLCPLAPT
jgi:hypothetical protein